MRLSGIHLRNAWSCASRATISARPALFARAMRLTSLARASRAAHLSRFAAFCTFALLAANCARAEYIVLRSGQRLNVNAYQLVGDAYHLQVAGGFVDVPASEVVRIEPEEIFTPSAPAPHQATAEPFREFIRAAAAKYSVDADLIASVIAAESNFDPKAISRRNARGLMQLLPATAARLGVRDIFDPQENIEGGTRYLAELLARYRNDLELTLAAYNAGPERVEQYGAIPPYAETLSYVRSVKKTYSRRKSTDTPSPAYSAFASSSSSVSSAAKPIAMDSRLATSAPGSSTSANFPSRSSSPAKPNLPRNPPAAIPGGDSPE